MDGTKASGQDALYFCSSIQKVNHPNLNVKVMTQTILSKGEREVFQVLPVTLLHHRRLNVRGKVLKYTGSTKSFAFQTAAAV